MTTNSYSEKLKDPRWQKKRLSIMERDRWQCKMCFTETVTLNVHHLFYDKGKDPWEYDNGALITLCEDCHRKEHDFSSIAKDELFEAFKRVGFTVLDILTIKDGINLRCIVKEKHTHLAYCLSSMFASSDGLEKVYDLYKEGGFRG